MDYLTRTNGRRQTRGETILVDNTATDTYTPPAPVEPEPPSPIYDEKPDYTPLDREGLSASVEAAHRVAKQTGNWTSMERVFDEAEKLIAADNKSRVAVARHQRIEAARVKKERMQAQNAEFETTAKTHGIKYYKDRYGYLRPEVQAHPTLAGKQIPVYREEELGERDDKRGERWLARRDRFGRTVGYKPNIVANHENPDDPDLYFDFPSGRVRAGHGDDMTNHADPSVRKLARDAQQNRRKALNDAAIKPLQTELAESESEIAGAKLRLSDPERLARRTTLADQIAALDAAPDAKQDGSGWFSNRNATAEYRANRAQRETLQTQLTQLDTENASLNTIVAKESPAQQRAERAKLLIKQTKEHASLDDYEAQEKYIAGPDFPGTAAQRKAMLANIASHKKRLGIELSETAKMLAAQQAAHEEIKKKAELSAPTIETPEDANRLVDQYQAAENDLNSAAEAFRALPESTPEDERRQRAQEVQKKYESCLAARATLAGAETKSKIAQDAAAESRLKIEATSLEKARENDPRKTSHHEWNIAKGYRKDPFNKDSAPARADASKEGNWDRLINELGENLYAIASNYKNEDANNSKTPVTTAVAKNLGAVFDSIGAPVRAVFNTLNCVSAESLHAEKQAEYAKQMIGDFSGKDAETVLRRTRECASELAAGKQLVAPREGDIYSVGSLTTLRDPNAGFVETVAKHIPVYLAYKTAKESGTFFNDPATLQRMINDLRKDNVPELSTFFVNFAQSLGASMLNSDYIDTKNPEEFAKLNALRAEAAALLQEKNPNAEIFGRTFGSFTQFLVARGIGRAAGGAVSGGINRAAEARRFAKFAPVLKKASQLTGKYVEPAVGYGLPGTAQAITENPDGSLSDILKAAALNTAAIAFTEKAGDKLFAHKSAASPSYKRFAVKSVQNFVRGTAAEMTSDVLQSALNNERLNDQFLDSLKGNAGATLAMTAWMVAGGRRGLGMPVYNKAGNITGFANRNIGGELGAVKALKELGAAINETSGDLESACAPAFAILNTAKNESHADFARAQEILEYFPQETAENLQQRLKNYVNGEPHADIHNAADPLGAALDNASAKFINAHTLAAESTDFARRAAQIDAALDDIDRIPDYAPANPERIRKTDTPPPASTNRDAARALVKLSQGKTPETLTERETAALKTIGADTGTEMFSKTKTGTVITDTAREWLGNHVTGTDSFIPEESVARSAARDEKQNKTAAGTDKKQPSESSVKSVVENPDLRVSAAPREKKHTHLAYTPDALESSLARALHASSAGNAPKESAAAAKSLRTQLSDALDAWKSVFTDGIEIREGQSLKSGGVIIENGKLVIITNDLTAPDNLQTIDADPRRIAQLVTEEAVHAVAQREIPAAEITDIWQNLPEKIRADVTNAYADGKQLSDYTGGHEFVRMIVQGRITPEQIITETTDKKLLARIADVFERILDYCKNLREKLVAEGATPETAARIDDAATRVENIVRALRGKNNPSDKSAPPDQSEKPSVQPVPVAVKEEKNLRDSASPRETSHVSSATYPVASPASAFLSPVSPENRAQTARALALPESQIGHAERITHRGESFNTVNILIDPDEILTSHNPDGTLNPDYPQYLQPRDRSDAAYRVQQQQIAKNPSLDEEAKQGSPDNGPPIVTRLDDGRLIVLIGNGRANAKKLMYSNSGYNSAAQNYTQNILPQIAAQRGIRLDAQTLSPSAPARSARLVLARVITDPLAIDQLQKLSQESNRSSGAETNAVEQARTDASRITDGILSLLNPEYDLEAGANADFRARFTAETVGTAANISPAQLTDRITYALFAKAYGDTPEALGSLRRILAESDAQDGTRQIATSLANLAPRMAAARLGINEGTLHDRDIAPEIVRALNTIAATLQNKPKGISNTAALEAVGNQGLLELAAPEEKTLPLETQITRFIIDNRRAPRRIEKTLESYLNALEAAGNPREGDMFGYTPPEPAKLWQTAVLASDPKVQTLRTRQAAQNWESVRPGDQFARIKKLIPVDGKRPAFDTHGTEISVFQRVRDFLKETKRAKDPWGDWILLANPQRNGQFDDALLNRAAHITGANAYKGYEQRTLDTQKTAWVAAVPETIANAQVKVKHGSEIIYYRRYAEGLHKVVTDGQRKVIDQEIFAASLITQYAPKPIDRNEGVVVGVHRISPALSVPKNVEGSLNPDPALSGNTNASKPLFPVIDDNPAGKPGDVKPDTLRSRPAYVQRDIGARALHLYDKVTPQIKSATGNRGTFDPQSKNILRSRAAASKEVNRATMPRTANTPEEVNAALREIRKKEITNARDGTTATVPARSIRELTRGTNRKHSVNEAAHNLAAANVDALFERAERIDSHPDKYAEPQVANIHRYASPMLFEDDVLGVIITVKELTGDQGNRIYAIQALDVTKKPAEAGLVDEQPAVETTEDSGSISHEAPTVTAPDYTGKLRDIVEKVKQARQILQNNGTLRSRASSLSGIPDPRTAEALRTALTLHDAGAPWIFPADKLPRTLAKSAEILHSRIASEESATNTGQTKTPAFKKWFGDSSVTERNGNPLIVYHRSRTDFDTFDKSKFGSNTDAGWLGHGFYFYGDKAESERAYGYGKLMRSFYLKIENPYFITDAEAETLAEKNNSKASEAFSERLKSEGYDGVYYNGNLRQEWVAFEPHQIKSATDNNGEFDPNNPSILRSRPAVADQLTLALALEETVADRITRNEIPDTKQSEQSVSSVVKEKDLLNSSFLNLTSQIALGFVPAGADTATFVSRAHEITRRAAQAYDPAHGIPFEKFAAVAVRRAMIDQAETAQRHLRKNTYLDPQDALTLLPDQVTDVVRFAELADARAALADAVETLSPRLRKVAQRILAGDTQTEIAEFFDISPAGVSNAWKIARERLRSHLETKGITRTADLIADDAGDNVIEFSSTTFDSLRRVASRPPSARVDSQEFRDTAAWLKSLKNLTKDIPSPEEVAALYRRAGIEIEALERDGTERTVGNPKLANPGNTPETRLYHDANVYARRDMRDRQTFEQWTIAAHEALARDPAGAKRHILEKIEDNALLSDVETEILRTLYIQASARAAAGDITARDEANILSFGWEQSGRELGRAMAFRRDQHKSPAQRAREFIADAFFGSPKKSAANPHIEFSKNARRIEALQNQITKLKIGKSDLRASAPPRENDARLAVLETRLGKEIAERKRLEAQIKELRAVPGKLEKHLQKMGIRPQDIFDGEAYLRLRGAKIIDNQMNAVGMNATDRKIIRLIQGRHTSGEIAAKLDISAEYVKTVQAGFEKALRARLEKLGDAALDIEKFDIDALHSRPAAGNAVMTLLSSRSALTAEERAAKIDALIAAMSVTLPDTDTFAQTRRRVLKTQKKKSLRASASPRENLPPDAPRTIPDAPGVPVKQHTGHNGQTEFYPEWNPDGIDITANPVDLNDPVQAGVLMRLVASQQSATWYDGIREYYINSLLSGPKTHIVNITSNALNLAWEYSFKRLGEAMLNDTLRTASGGRLGSATAAHLGEIKHIVRAATPALARGWRHMLAAWHTETPSFAAEVLDNQMDLELDTDKSYTRTAIPGIAGQIIRTPGRALMAADEFFKGLVGQLEVAAQAYRLGKAEGFSGKPLDDFMAREIDTPASAAWQAAYKKAVTLTFQDRYQDTALEHVVKAADFVKNKVPGGFLILPFTTTPLNIFVEGIRQSPVGAGNILLRSGAHLLNKATGGKVGSEYAGDKAIKHLSEQLIAWTAGAILYGAAAGDDDDKDKQILITGSMQNMPRSKREHLNRLGIRPYTIRVGNFRLDYSRLDPAATAVGLAVDMASHAKRAEHQDDFDPLNALLAGIGSQLQTKTFLTGLADLLAALDGEGNKAENYAARTLASVIPNIIKQPLREFDPDFREKPGTFTGNALRQVASGTAEPSINLYGDIEKKPMTGLLRQLLPVTISETPSLTRLDTALYNWNKDKPTADDGRYYPAEPARSVTHNGKKVSLTDAQYTQYKIRTGVHFAMLMKHISLNVDKPTESDVKRIKNALKFARDKAKNEVLRGK